MQTNTNPISTRNLSLFLLCLFIYQLLFLFQGVDFLDEGFLAVFFDQMFEKPEMHAYNFMFWLTGVLGAGWIKMFPGILSIRIAGALVVTLTAAITSLQLRRHISSKHLLIAISGIVLAMNNDVKSINYNNLSALFYVVAIFALTNGLEQKNRLLVYISGGIFGLSVFLRTPNLLSVSFLIIVPAQAYFSLQFRASAILRNVIIFLFGFVTLVLTVILIMYFIGHWNIYKESLNMLWQMGKGDPSVKNIESNYGILKLLKQPIDSAFQAAKALIITTAILLLPSILEILFPAFFRQFRYLTVFISILVGIGLGILFTTENNSRFFPIFAFSGLVLFASVLIFFRHVSGYIKTLMTAGLIFMISYPIGSSAGIFSAGRYSLWIAFPLALDMILNLKKIDFSVLWHDLSEKCQLTLQLKANARIPTLSLACTLFLYVSFYFAYRYPIFDNYDRLTMKGRIENNKLSGIKTTSEKATLVNELLVAAKKYVKPGDTVMIYDCMPLIQYLTETAPYIKNSHPILYEPLMFKNQLDSAFAKYENLPTIIKHNFRTMGYDVKWPEQENLDNYPKWEYNSLRNQFLATFLLENHYQETWSNKYFQILAPKEKRKANINKKQSE